MGLRNSLQLSLRVVFDIRVVLWVRIDCPIHLRLSGLLGTHHVTGNSRRLDDSAYLGIESVPPMHHLFEDLLLSGLRVSLILLTNDILTGVISQSEKVGLRVKTVVRHRLIRVARGVRVLDYVQARWHAALTLDYGRLPTRWGVNAPLRLVHIVIVQQAHMLGKLGLFTWSLLRSVLIVFRNWTFDRSYPLEMRPSGLIYLQVFGEVLLCYAKVLIFKLLNTAL